MVTDRTLVKAGLAPAFCLLIALLAPSAGAAPVADDERTPIDLRRTTLVVSDIDQSLAFYRDALGMVVTYDNLILTPRDAENVENAERASRLVFLRSNDDYIGVLGLLQYLKPRKDTVEIRDKSFHEGTIVLVTNNEDARAAHAKAIAVEGANSLWEPQETSYPSYDGSSTIRVLVSGAQDPDGFVVEINQLLGEEPAPSE